MKIPGGCHLSNFIQRISTTLLRGFKDPCRSGGREQKPCRDPNLVAGAGTLLKLCCAVLATTDFTAMEHSSRYFGDFKFGFCKNKYVNVSGCREAAGQVSPCCVCLRLLFSEPAWTGLSPLQPLLCVPAQVPLTAVHLPGLASALPAPAAGPPPQHSAWFEGRFVFLST